MQAKKRIQSQEELFKSRLDQRLDQRHPLFRLAKAIAYPTDARLYYKMRVKLVKIAEKHGIELRQNCRRLGKKALVMQGRYAHARQMKRARKETKKLKMYLGRITRELRRKTVDAVPPSLTVCD